MVIGRGDKGFCKDKEGVPWQGIGQYHIKLNHCYGGRIMKKKIAQGRFH